MAQTGFTPIQLYSSSTPTNAPSAGNLTNDTKGSELAINIADKNLFFKDSTNAVNTVPIRQSSASSDGWLSSTDWNTFNSKQPALVSGVNIKTVSGTTLLGSGDLGTIGVGYGGTGTSTAFTTGSVVFAGASGVYSQDNANLFWDNTNDRLGVGTTSPLARLSVNETNTAAVAADIARLTTTSGGVFAVNCSDLSLSQPTWTIQTGNAEPLTFVQSSTEAMRIDTSQRLLVGTSAAIGTARIQSASVSTDPFEGYRFGANANGPTISLYKNRGASVGANTVVASGDELGTLAFRGYDGAAYRAGAFITGAVDGTPGSSDMPGRLVFSTTADGAATPTERMRIHNSGGVSIGNTTDPGATNLSVTGNVVIATSGKGIDFSATAGTGTSELLADYEEGTWTPVDGSGASLSFTSASGVYTKVGRQVTVFFTLVYPTTANANAARIGGLPFTAANSTNGFNSGAFNVNNSGQVVQPSIVANDVLFAALLTATGTSATNAQLTGASLRGGFSYFV